MIEVNNIVKYYNDFPAVRGISFKLTENGVYGFLGPNGAGKSTSMNIMTGCLAATSGTVKIDGFDIYEEAEQAKRQLGYLPEQPPLYMDMTPAEYLRFVGRARKVPKSELKEQIEHALEVTGITPVRDRLIKHLSKGYKQRVGIAETLLGNPKVIILDEPTVGLDPRQITEIRDLVHALGKDHIVLFSSHILSEVQTICEHVMIIAKGTMIANCPTDEVEQLLHRTPELRLHVRAEKEAAEKALAEVASICSLEYTGAEGELSCFRILTEQPEETAEAIFHVFAARKLPIIEMNHIKPTLEDAFLELTNNLSTYDPETGELEKKAEAFAEASAAEQTEAAGKED